MQMAQAAIQAVERQAERNRALPPAQGVAAPPDNNAGFLGSLSRLFHFRNAPTPSTEENAPQPEHHPPYPTGQPGNPASGETAFPVPPPASGASPRSAAQSARRPDRSIRHSRSAFAGPPYPPANGAGDAGLRRRHRAASNSAATTPPYPTTAQCGDDLSNSEEFFSPSFPEEHRRSVPAEHDAFSSIASNGVREPDDLGMSYIGGFWCSGSDFKTLAEVAVDFFSVNRGSTFVQCNRARTIRKRFAAQNKHTTVVRVAQQFINRC